MFRAAGEKAAREAFEKAYRTKRRPKIMGVKMPVPQSVLDTEWAARWALHDMDLHTRIWEITRSVDCELITEREKK